MKGLNSIRHHVLWCGLAAAFPVAADTDKQTELPRVEITGRPVVETNRVDPFASIATEVTDRQVKDLNALDLAAALRRTPGVTITRFNAVGSFDGSEGGAVFVRGIGASRPGSEIKTYIDGVPFYTPTGNHPLLDLVPIHGMERIVVHKGPHPQSFANTFAAIDLRPKRATQEGASGDLKLAAGSFSTFVEQANVVAKQGNFDAMIAQGRAESDGHRQASDGRVDNVLARLGLKLGENWSSGLTFLHAENTVSDPGEERDPANTRNGTFHTRGTLLALTLAHEHADARGSLKLYDSSSMSHVFGAAPALGVPERRSTGDMRGLRARETLVPWAQGELHLGLDVDEIRGRSSFPELDLTLFEDLKMRLVSPHIALSHTVSAGGWELTPSAGVRFYRHDTFGNSTAPHAGLTAAGGPVELRVSFARGINYPALDAPLVNFLVNASGDPADPPILDPDAWRSVRPERMNHVEVGGVWRWGETASVDLALFHDTFRNRYLFVTDPTPAILNLGEYTVRGAELTWHQQLDASFAVFAGLTLLYPSLDDLPYAPRRALSGGVLWQQGPWRLGVDMQSQSKTRVLGRDRIGGAPNTELVGGFMVVNARAAYALQQLGPRGEVFLAIENLTDRRYAFRPGYPMPGLSAQAGVNLSF